jgi:hypothetical protein
MKVLFIMLIVMLLVAFAAPAFADKGGLPNDNAAFGQAHKALAEVGSVSEEVHAAQEAAGTNLGQYIKDVVKPAP